MNFNLRVNFPSCQTPEKGGCTMTLFISLGATFVVENQLWITRPCPQSSAKLPATLFYPMTSIEMNVKMIHLLQCNAFERLGDTLHTHDNVIRRRSMVRRVDRASYYPIRSTSSSYFLERTITFQHIRIKLPQLYTCWRRALQWHPTMLH